MMKIALSHPTGNQNVRSVLKALFDAGLLTEFTTSISVKEKAKILKLLPAELRTTLQRRSFSLPDKLIKTYPALELARMICPKIGFKKAVEHEIGWASTDAVYNRTDKKVADRLAGLKKQKKITGVYAYEDGALLSFTKAKELDIECIYDLPIAYWETGRQLMKEEAERLPAWAETLGGGIIDSEKKLEKKTREMELADVIVCPGKFVKDSVPVWAKNKKIIVSPFGSPPGSAQKYTFSDTGTSLNNRPLRILFAGSMGQRKGLGDLFAAIKLLNSSHFELVVMGSLRSSLQFYKNQYSNFRYEAGRPNNEVLELMRNCDIFCLPSIVEGRALVMQEAMSQGLPLIITPNTGGEDLVIDGKTGFLVPIRSPEKIAEKLTWYHDNRPEIPAMSIAAQQHAANYTWENYGKNIVAGLKEYLQ